MAYDCVNGTCILNTAYGTPGFYATLTDCENAVNDGSVTPILILNPTWEASKKVSLPLTTTKLGDGYQQTIFEGTGIINEEWSITSPILFGTQSEDLLNQLRMLCATSFLWSPNNGVIPYKEFTCDQWKKTRVGINTYQVSTTFKMAILG
ncbi:MAG: hypothetical protein ACYTXA_05945 [Nostoc sp.]